MLAGPSEQPNHPLTLTPKRVKVSTLLFIPMDSPIYSTAPNLAFPVSTLSNYREQEKGLVAPQSSHDDAVLDVKVTELPIKMLLSGSRDGAVKIWR